MSRLFSRDFCFILQENLPTKILLDTSRLGISNSVQFGDFFFLQKIIKEKHEMMIPCHYRVAGR